MIRACLLLADGFEQTEALTTQDIFHRSHEIETTLVSISSSLSVFSSIGLNVEANELLENIDEKDFDFLVLPGGKLGVENLKNSKNTLDLIRKFKENGKPVFAICAAPSILGELGYLDGKRYVCFPGFEKGKGEYIDTGVVVDGDLITSRSMGHTIAFAEAIVSYFLGEEAISRVRKGTMGL